MDVLELIKNVRISKLLANVLTKGRQRELVKFFKDYTPRYVSSAEEPEHSNDKTISEENDVIQRSSK